MEEKGNKRMKKLFIDFIKVFPLVIAWNLAMPKEFGVWEFFGSWLCFSIGLKFFIQDVVKEREQE